jgi:hypothetical protein
MERMLSVSLAVGCVLAAVAAKPTVSDVSFTQNVAKRNFTVTYTLADAPAVITFDVLTNGVSIGAKNVTPCCRRRQSPCRGGKQPHVCLGCGPLLAG